MNSIVSVTVHSQGAPAPCIKLIRAFDPTLTVGELGANIKAGRPAFSFDLEYYDVVEDLNGIDRRKIFRRLLEELEAQGARLEMTLTRILTSGTSIEPFTLKDFDNYMDFSEEIRRQVELDCDREAEE
ncbi:hypothetical protein D1646_09080 [Pseudoflavonifractor sp. 60]|uniref:hypothetical protein n=1 Tax=Pseudoflavonifractor sp. 60 TaxID=2304576 RepID=UPI001371A996|nr:hypothetical protein [Pseudoflavonifractor sp. 60]NBI66966.1 hypothetical protein [Pseudoflavonifractor sp. 60]